MDRRDLDEYMETLWYLAEEDRLTTDDLQNWVEATFDEEIFAHLQEERLIAVQGKKIELPLRDMKRPSRLCAATGWRSGCWRTCWA